MLKTKFSGQAQFISGVKVPHPPSPTWHAGWMLTVTGREKTSVERLNPFWKRKDNCRKIESIVGRLNSLEEERDVVGSQNRLVSCIERSMPGQATQQRRIRIRADAASTTALGWGRKRQRHEEGWPGGRTRDHAHVCMWCSA